MAVETAIFGAGCFWGVEEAFRRLPGVRTTEVGYAGGRLENPTYRQVCSGSTGHAEVVRVEYDPAEVSYDDLLQLFWRCHDPTQLNRQGPDHGEQYRSVIFYTSPEQKRMAEESRQALQESGRCRNPVVTAIEPAGAYYRAEEYHQQYIARGAGRCRVVG